MTRVSDPQTRLRVRPATHADQDQVWPLARDLATSYTVERPAFERSFAALLAHPDAIVLVAERDGSILGYLLATTHLAFHANAPVVWIEELMVAAPHRAQGIGRRLTSAAESWSRSLGAAYVALATRRAAPFYQALAYEDSAVYFRKLLE
jgi:GNAT superfamily N-acetyltransferase